MIVGWPLAQRILPCPGGHCTTTVCHLGHIAVQLRRRLAGSHGQAENSGEVPLHWPEPAHDNVVDVAGQIHLGRQYPGAVSHLLT